MFKFAYNAISTTEFYYFLVNVVEIHLKQSNLFRKFNRDRQVIYHFQEEEMSRVAKDYFVLVFLYFSGAIL